jgi:hypothetical protein
MLDCSKKPAISQKNVRLVEKRSDRTKNCSDRAKKHPTALKNIRPDEKSLRLVEKTSDRMKNRSDWSKNSPIGQKNNRLH